MKISTIVNQVVIKYLKSLRQLRLLRILGNIAHAMKTLWMMPVERVIVDKQKNDAASKIWWLLILSAGALSDSVANF